MRGQRVLKVNAAHIYKALPMYEAESKERQRASGRFYGENHPQEDVPIVEQALEPKSIERAASAFGVGKQYIAVKSLTLFEF
jgi:hypothetical protein